MTDTKTDTINADKEVKDLPDLSKIESKDWFKAAYDAHKSDEYRSMLDDLGVGYLASDNKIALTYRYLDATNGLQNDSKVTAVESDTKDSKTDTTASTKTEGAQLDAHTTVSLERVNDQSEVKVAASTAKSTTNTDNKAKFETISVKSKLGRDVLESATGTRIVAGKTTKITTTAKVTRERILANLKQINVLNGNQLTFDE